MMPNQLMALFQTILVEQVFGPEFGKRAQPFILAFWGCSMSQQDSTMFD